MSKSTKSTKSTKQASTPSTTTSSPAPVAPAPPATATASAPPTAPITTPPPDPNAALAAVVQQALTQLDAIDTSLGSDPPLTALQKRHAARMRKGGPAILTAIANLTTDENLAPPAMSVAAMTCAGSSRGKPPAAGQPAGEADPARGRPGLCGPEQRLGERDQVLRDPAARGAQ